MAIHEKSDNELVERFVLAAQRSESTIERIKKDPRALKTALMKAVEGIPTVLFAEPEDLAIDLFVPFRESFEVISKPDENHLRRAEIGITDAFAGVARTGSICVSYSRNLSGTISLFARTHVAVLDAKTIVERPRDVFTTAVLKDKALSRDFVIITGPSSTADMGPLVRGVHGPGKLHIIILE